MLNDCYKYSTAINAKGELFPTEAVLMSLIFQQQKMIDWLIVQISWFKRSDNSRSKKKESQ